MNNKIGTELKRARKDHKITQAKLSELTGFSRSTLTKYELGVIDISLNNFIKVCEAIGERPTVILKRIMK